MGFTFASRNQMATVKQAVDAAEALDRAEACALVLQLDDPRAAGLVARLAADYPEMNEVLEEAVEDDSRLLLAVLLDQGDRCVCVAVQGLANLPEALFSLHDRISPLGGETAWIVIPQTLCDEVHAQLEAFWEGGPIH